MWQAPCWTKHQIGSKRSDQQATQAEYLEAFDFDANDSFDVSSSDTVAVDDDLIR